jgi:lipase chaperone LimK
MQKLLTPTVTTVVQDATDPSNIRTSTSTKAGVGPEEAQRVLQMRMQRGSEGMAFNVGSMFEEALTRMG